MAFVAGLPARRAAAAWLAAAFLVAHLPFLARSLDDIDAVNFALGVERFDPAAHRPHPPGYPIFTALGKLSSVVIARDAAALAVWGAVFGAVAILAFARLFRALQSLEGEGRAGWPLPLAAALLTMACPLYWFSAVRPMSDIPGLAVAAIAQALLAAAFARQGAARLAGAAGREAASATIADSGRLIVLGALAAGLGIGVRLQSAWLTLPLLAAVLLDRAGRGAAGALLGSAMAFSIGVLAWGVPLLIASGGFRAYLRALGSQAGEDFAGVDMLWLAPTPRRLAAGLFDTFISPWESPYLAVAVIALASLGAVATLRRAPRAVALVAALSWPYAIFHVVFQETITTRYALPLIPPVAYLAARGIAALGGRLRALALGALAVMGLAIGVPAVVSYADTTSPVTRAYGDLRGRWAARPDAMLAMHHVFRRPLEREGLDAARTLPSPPRHEWLELVKYWRDGGHGPVWFLADPRRTDLALIDAAGSREFGAYRWPIPIRRLMSGARPATSRVVEIPAPGWFLAEGWSLTPETAGIARADNRGPDRASIVGYLRRRNTPAVLMIGGRNLAPAGAAAARFTLTIDGALVHAWEARPNPGFFLEMIPLPSGIGGGTGSYARLEVSSAPVQGGRAPAPTAIEQFDLQDADRVVFGYAEGWHELELNPATGRTWRWSSDRASIRVHHASRDVALRVIGESPLRYFDRPVQLVVRAGSEVLRRESLASDFDVSVRIPAGALERGAGVLTLETDNVFVPAERGASGDRRRLSLRIYSVEMSPVR